MNKTWNKNNSISRDKQVESYTKRLRHGKEKETL